MSWSKFKTEFAGESCIVSGNKFLSISSSFISVTFCEIQADLHFRFTFAMFPSHSRIPFFVPMIVEVRLELSHEMVCLLATLRELMDNPDS